MIEKTAFLGELSLDGQVKPIRGALPLAMGLRQQGIRRLVLPENNLREVALLKDMRLYPVRTLAESLAYARGKNKTGSQCKRRMTVRWILPERNSVTSLDRNVLNGQL